LLDDQLHSTRRAATAVDELALHVLADLIASHELDEYYTLKYSHDLEHGYSANKAAQQAIAEAMSWLRSQGMIARQPANTSSDAIFVTRWGHDASTKQLAEVRAVARVQANLHPLIQSKVRAQFLLGEYENAIFVAMKAVEVRVRKLASYGDDMYGLEMMTKAFKPGGPLADPAMPGGEVEGTMALFRGAYAVLRNPSGHREVSFDDVTEASEAVMTASLLMRMLDRIEQRMQS
jgi:uncharacterized protein (TIGR02391 family)